MTHAIAMARSWARQPSAANETALREAGLRSLSGGRNNRVFALDHGGEPLCLKLFAVDDRGRAEREWRALTFLHDRGLQIAPQPLLFDPDPAQPAIVMELLPGTPLHAAPLTHGAFDALYAALSQIHAITPAAATYPHVVVGTIGSMIARIGAWHARTAGTHDRLMAECCALVSHWMRGDDRDVLTHAAPLVFGRGDPNLANCLYHDSRVRCVDWEYAGWSDLAYELADLIEGPWARPTGDDSWRAFVDRFGAVSHDPRFGAARRMVACFWIYKLSDQYAAGELPPERLVAQIARARRLLIGQQTTDHGP